jgi:Cys-tRNA(Pro)/Cys-tRNA(Cys) deacylase
MINGEEKLKRFIKEQGIRAEHLRFGESLHTVQDTLRVTGFDLDNITKTMIFKGQDGRTVAAVVPAKFRVSVSALCEATGIEELELANPNEAYERTGYPVGGMPCFGYEAILVADPAIFDREYIYTGGGSEFSLTKISTQELKRIKDPLLRKIKGKKSN